METTSPMPVIRALVTRRVTDEETVQFEVNAPSVGDLRANVRDLLEDLRDHRRRHNDEVIAVFQSKSDELDRAIDVKGQVVRDLDHAIAEKELELRELTKKVDHRRLKSAS